MKRTQFSCSVYVTWLAAVALLCGAGCLGPRGESSDPAAAKALVIRWVRLVDTGGSTCDRCGGTERSIDEAHRLLATSLNPLGILVGLEKVQFSPERFKLDPSESNRIWIADQPLETILGAKSGMSQCGGCCGDSACRTTVVDGRTYETIPPELIVRAGLKVAANMIQPASPCTPSLAAGSEQFWQLTWNPFATKGPWFEYLQQQKTCGGH